jgi:hypothetical protein
MNEEEAKYWKILLLEFRNLLGKSPDLNGILFLIGIQELGQGPKSFTKEEKQDLMHIALCRILSYAGYYELQGIDQDGWPHWKLIKPLPSAPLRTQENLIKGLIIRYFKEHTDLIDYEDYNL